MFMDELLEEHKRVLATKPVDISDDEYASLLEDHAKSNCPLCTKNVTDLNDPDERGDMEKNYTKADIDEAVAAAVAPLKDELDSIKNSAESAAQEAKLEEVKAEADEKVTAAQAEVDTATLEATNAKTELANVIAWLESEKAAAEQASLLESRKEARIAQVKEAAAFEDDYIAKRIDAWVAMDDEAFDSYLEDWKAIPSAPAMESAAESPAPLETAVEGTRTDAPKTGSLTALVRKGVNLNTI